MTSLDRAVATFLLEQRNLQASGIGDRRLARVAEALFHVANVAGAVHRQPLRPRTEFSHLGARLLVADFVLDVAADALEAAVSARGKTKKRKLIESR